LGGFDHKREESERAGDPYIADLLAEQTVGQCGNHSKTSGGVQAHSKARQSLLSTCSWHGGGGYIRVPRENAELSSLPLKKNNIIGGKRIVRSRELKARRQLTEDPILG